MKMQGFSNYEIYPQEGRIWSYKRNKFIGNKRKDGYLGCALYGDNSNVWHTTLHRVIWIAVNGDIPQGYDVNHIDENKDNNSIDNLNLMTRKENNNYGTRNERIGNKNKGKTLSKETKQKISQGNKGKYISKKTKYDISQKMKGNNNASKQVAAYKDGVLMMIFPSTMEAHRQGYHSGAISACCNGLRQSHKGFQWQYM